MTQADIESFGLKTGEKIKLRKVLSGIMMKDNSVASLSHMVPLSENPSTHSSNDDGYDPTATLQDINQVHHIKVIY